MKKDIPPRMYDENGMLTQAFLKRLIESGKEESEAIEVDKLTEQQLTEGSKKYWRSHGQRQNHGSKGNDKNNNRRRLNRQRPMLEQMSDEDRRRDENPSNARRMMRKYSRQDHVLDTKQQIDEDLYPNNPTEVDNNDNISINRQVRQEIKKLVRESAKKWKGLESEELISIFYGAQKANNSPIFHSVLLNTDTGGYRNYDIRPAEIKLFRSLKNGLDKDDEKSRMAYNKRFIAFKKQLSKGVVATPLERSTIAMVVRDNHQRRTRTSQRSNYHKNGEYMGTTDNWRNDSDNPNVQEDSKPSERRFSSDDIRRMNEKPLTNDQKASKNQAAKTKHFGKDR